MIQVKRAPGGAKPSTSGGIAAAINKIPVKRMSNGQPAKGSSPAAAVNMITVKKTPQSAAVKKVNMIQVKKSPAVAANNGAKLSFANAIPVKKSPGPGGLAATNNVAGTSKLSQLPPGVTVTKLANNDDDDCIVLD